MEHQEYEEAKALLLSLGDRHLREPPTARYLALDYALLAYALLAYEYERQRPQPRLSYLRTALRALTGALRDRMGE